MKTEQQDRSNWRWYDKEMVWHLKRSNKLEPYIWVTWTRVVTHRRKRRQRRTGKAEIQWQRLAHNCEKCSREKECELLGFFPRLGWKVSNQYTIVTSLCVWSLTVPWWSSCAGCCCLSCCCCCCCCCLSLTPTSCCSNRLCSPVRANLPGWFSPPNLPASLGSCCAAAASGLCWGEQ